MSLFVKSKSLGHLKHMLNNFTGKKKVEMGRDRERKGGGWREENEKKKCS